jgi:hypothetical protein
MRLDEQVNVVSWEMPAQLDTVHGVDFAPHFTALV